MNFSKMIRTLPTTYRLIRRPQLAFAVARGASGDPTVIKLASRIEIIKPIRENLGLEGKLRIMMAERLLQRRDILDMVRGQKIVVSQFEFSDSVSGRDITAFFVMEHRIGMKSEPSS